MRLAQAAAATHFKMFDEGVVFVDLAPLRAPGLVATAIARALGLQEGGPSPAADLLRAYLGNRHILLLLDNFEQLLPATPLLAELLRACPRIGMLVTSREAFRLSAEQQLEVRPLELPDRTALSAETIGCAAAVQLFVDRCRAVESSFRLDVANAKAIADVFVRLDGLPLALELAAARIRMLPPQATLKRLDQLADLLETRSEDRPTRHRTLRGYGGLELWHAIRRGARVVSAIGNLCRWRHARGS